MLTLSSLIIIAARSRQWKSYSNTFCISNNNLVNIKNVIPFTVRNQINKNVSYCKRW